MDRQYRIRQLPRVDRRSFLLSSACLLLDAAAGPTPATAQTGPPPEPDDALRIRMMHDPLRPQYHLLPRYGHVGDPCAPRFFRGAYHVFHHGSVGGRGWAHSVSSDLVHWRHLPRALWPTPGSWDDYGAFTGSVLPGTPQPSIMYTAVTKVPHDQETIRNEGLREVQCLATSPDPDLATWQKLEQPVILNPPVKVVGFRDPCPFQDERDKSTWYVAIGSGFPGVGGAALLYRSHDTRTWEYLHPLAQGVWNGKDFSNPVDTAEMWECPDFFPLGDKHVLLYSTVRKVFWEVGAYDRQALRFHSEKKGMLDHGAYYAPKSMIDAQGRRILWGWVQETRPREDSDAAGWSGAISLPRILSISPEGELLMQVAPELAQLRRNTKTLRARDIAQPQYTQQPSLSHSRLDLAFSDHSIPGRAGEIILQFVPGQLTGQLQLTLQTPSAIVPLLTATLDAGPTPTVTIGDATLPCHPDAQGSSTLHLWVDASVIEVFLDSREAATVRTYAAPSETGTLRLTHTPPAAAGQPAPSSQGFISLTTSEIAPASPDRMTT